MQGIERPTSPTIFSEDVLDELLSPLSSICPKKSLEIGPNYQLNLSDFWSVVRGRRMVNLSEACKKRLEKTELFIKHLLDKKEKVYGLTTGFADLRDYCVPIEKAAQLSHNIIHSHDAGIGKPMRYEVVLGAMLLRANSLAKGKSAFTLRNLMVLVDMINKRVVPMVPISGSLGASGDLAYLARVGRAMEGCKVKVWVDGKTDPGMLTCDMAMKKLGIESAHFGPKEGLALTNGTPFLCSAAVLAFNKLVKVIENNYGLLSMTMNAVHCVPDAYTQPIQMCKEQRGQTEVAAIIRKILEKGSPFLDTNGVQNDYLFRCIPQIFGYQFELIHRSYSFLLVEMNSVTDNPLVFCGEEVTDDVPEHRIREFQGEKWAVLSGGNFHGEYISQMCDSCTRCNVKPILTMERHLTYMMNPNRHKCEELPVYLIKSKDEDRSEVGLKSGLMIVQYTANAIAHKIGYFGLPMSVFNITSANESEDIVSYGASSAQKLLEQVSLMQDFSVLYATEALQSYSIAREELLKKGTVKSEDELKNLICDQVYHKFISSFSDEVQFPITDDISFERTYEEIREVLKTNKIREVLNYPMKIYEKFVNGDKKVTIDEDVFVEEEEDEGEVGK